MAAPLDCQTCDRVAKVVTGPYDEITLDGGGHWLREERADEVSGALVKFLADLQAGGD